MKCVICQDNKFKRMFSKVSYSRKFDFIKCKKCGFVTISPYFSKKELTDFYNADYDYSYMNLNNKRVLKINKNRLSFLLKFKNEGNLLDVGCGTGLFLNQAKKSFKVEGIEYSKYACDIAKNKFGLNVYNKDIDSLKLNKTYDVVSLFHVLEHIREPDKFLENSKKIIKKNGLLYVIVPNIDSFSFKFFGKYWEWLNPPKHLSYFNVNTLKKLFKRKGYEIVEIKTQKGDDYNFLFNFIFLLINFLGFRQILLNKMIKKNSKSSGISMYDLVFSITDFFSNLFYPLRVLFEKNNMGSEISVVAKKR